MRNAFELKIIQQIERFKHYPYQTLEAEVARKRMAWFRQHDPDLSSTGVSPRNGYELFFFEYLGLSAADVPVVAETDTAIVWRSLNRCPTSVLCPERASDL